MIQTKLIREIGEELGTLVGSSGRLGDALIPGLIFLIGNALLGFQAAIWASLAVTILIGVMRMRRRESPRYALGGAAGIAGAIIIAGLVGQGKAYFLPGMITGGLTIPACWISVLVQRPLAALISFTARHWPLAWYLHPRVRPAYNEVTLAWSLLFAIRLVIYYIFYQREDTNTLVVLDFISGWPGTIALLLGSYLYGTRRLLKLGGPSVAEFEAGAQPPWKGQQRGF